MAERYDTWSLVLLDIVLTLREKHSPFHEVGRYHMINQDKSDKEQVAGWCHPTESGQQEVMKKNGYSVTDTRIFSLLHTSNKRYDEK